MSKNEIKYGEKIPMSAEDEIYLIIYDLETNTYTSGFTDEPEQEVYQLSQKLGKPLVPVSWDTIKHLYTSTPTRHPTMGSQFTHWHKAGRKLLPFMTGGKIPRTNRWADDVL